MEVWGVDVCVVRGGGGLLLFPSFYVHIVMVAEDTVNNHTLRMGGGGGVVGLIVLLELPPMHCSVTTIKCSVALTRASQPVMVTSPQILFSTC